MSFVLGETNYVALELGEAATRVNYANHHEPPTVVPTQILLVPAEAAPDTEMADADAEGGAPAPAPAAATAPAHLVGDALAKHLAAHPADIAKVVRPFRPSANTFDWPALGEFLKLAVLPALKLAPGQHRSPVQAVVPAGFARAHREQLAKVLFDALGFTGVALIDAPLAALFGCGVATGCVVDIGYKSTTVTSIWDSNTVAASIKTTGFGGHTVTQYLRQLVASEPAEFRAALYGSTNASTEQKMHILEKLKLVPGLMEVTPVPPLTAAEITGEDKEIEWRAAKLKVPVRLYKGAAEVLFNPELLRAENGRPECIPITAAINLSIANVDIERRLTMWENMFVIGGTSAMKGLNERIEQELKPYIAAAETSNELQAKEVRYCRLPEYFVEFKDRPDYAAFLGGTIMARLTFIDAKMYVSRAEYAEHGARVLHAKT